MKYLSYRLEPEKAEAIEPAEVTVFKDGIFTASSTLISEEMPLTIYLNGQEITTMLCSPNDRKYLAIGFLVTEGMVKTIEDITKISVLEEDGLAYVEADGVEVVAETNYLKRSVTACCGRGRAGFYFANDEKTVKHVESRARYKASDIVKCSETLLQQASVTHQKTSGVHSGAVVENGEIILFAEDIGRHNVFDKLYGKALEQKIDLNDKLIVFTGRVSSEILIKVSKFNLPCVVAKSVPTSLALSLAKDLGITIAGCARNGSFNIYSHPERIVL